MKTIKQIRIENLNLLTRTHSRKEIAASAGYKDTVYINQLCRGIGSFGSGTARKIETGMRLPVGWMDAAQDSSKQRDHLIESALGTKSVGDPVQIIGSVPLISWVQAGEWHEPIDNLQPGDAYDMLPCPVPHSNFTYAVQVSGDSMADEYPEGYVIFVDPELDPKHRDDVIVRLLPENEVTFKRYMMDGGKPYLKAMNKDWPNPIIPINGDAEFCGVVIFAGKYPQKR